MSPTQLLSFNLVGCVKEVRNLINLPIMRLFGTRERERQREKEREYQCGSWEDGGPDGGWGSLGGCSESGPHLVVT